MSKPSWDDAPEWANWLALECYGIWYWHEWKPEWDENSREWLSDGRIEYTDVHNPEDSLEQRP
ncbi:hypothetical protein NG831_06340 [Xanthomonas sacchari]|nr:hypothetical protein [Xanthomonas sacchari]MCW0413516.1 hypothetical protein [Xanthomonas sacchari]UYK67778.1 hypothetical protein NG831_06340 [Xanthomonas sacchari]